MGQSFSRPLSASFQHIRLCRDQTTNTIIRLTCSERQYKRKVAEWGLEKNIRRSEKETLLNIINHNPMPNTDYPLGNGKVVPARKLHRHIRQARASGSGYSECLAWTYESANGDVWTVINDTSSSLAPLCDPQVMDYVTEDDLGQGMSQQIRAGVLVGRGGGGGRTSTCTIGSSSSNALRVQFLPPPTRLPTLNTSTAIITPAAAQAQMAPEEAGCSARRHGGGGGSRARGGDLVLHRGDGVVPTSAVGNGHVAGLDLRAIGMQLHHRRSSCSSAAAAVRSHQRVLADLMAQHYQGSRGVVLPAPCVVPSSPVAVGRTTGSARRQSIGGGGTRHRKASVGVVVPQRARTVSATQLRRRRRGSSLSYGGGRARGGSMVTNSPLEAEAASAGVGVVDMEMLEGGTASSGRSPSSGRENAGGANGGGGAQAHSLLTAGPSDFDWDTAAAAAAAQQSFAGPSDAMFDHHTGGQAVTSGEGSSSGVPAYAVSGPYDAAALYAYGGGDMTGGTGSGAVATSGAGFDPSTQAWWAGQADDGTAAVAPDGGFAGIDDFQGAAYSGGEGSASGGM